MWSIIIYRRRFRIMGKEEKLNCLFIVQSELMKTLQSPQALSLPVQAQNHLFVVFTVTCTFLANFLFPTSRKRWQHYFNSQCHGFSSLQVPNAI